MTISSAALGSSPGAPDAEAERRTEASGSMMREIDQGQLLASIAATSNDCIFSLDADGQVLWASPATERVLGWAPDDLAGRGIDVLFPRQRSELRVAALDRLLAGERVEPFVDSGFRRDGSGFKAEVMLGPVRGSEGTITGIIAILRDVTAQLDEQRELALALEMSRAHFDQSTTPQAILGLSGHLESVNPAWCELFGRGEGWFADCDVLDLVQPDEAEEVAHRLGRLRDGEIDSISYRGRFRDAEGGDLPLLLDATLLRDPSGTPYAIAASVGDLEHLGQGREASSADRPARRDLSEALAVRAWDTAVVLDSDLTISYVSPGVAAMLGYEPGDVLEHLGWEYVHPSDTGLLADLVEQLLGEHRRHERTLLRLRDASYQWRWIEVAGTNCLADPEIGGLVGNLRDVTEQVRTDQELRQSEALHRAMVETTPEGIMATSPEGTVVFANDTAGELMGRPVAELYGADPRDLLGLPAQDVDDVEVHEVAHVLPDGRERILQVSRRPLNSRNSGLGALLAVSDVTEVRQTERTLRRRALHDPLTSLPNRYLFLDRLETAAARQRRFESRGTAVLFLDLDRFKQVNDGFGHDVGDQVLRAVAVRMQESVRGTDTVGRLGGDEFAVICEDVGAEEAEAVARRILEAFDQPVRVEEVDHPTSVSIGVALAPPHSFDNVVRAADEAMYRGKQRGGGRIVVADR